MKDYIALILGLAIMVVIGYWQFCCDDWALYGHPKLHRFNPATTEERAPRR
jgi:hypothetical protein